MAQQQQITELEAGVAGVQEELAAAVAKANEPATKAEMAELKAMKEQIEPTRRRRGSRPAF